MTASTRSAAHIVSRVGAGLLGGYAFVWGFVTLSIACAVAAGMSYGDALKLTSWLAFLVFVACVCGAFAATKLARAWAVLGGGGVLMTGAAWIVSSALSGP